MDGYTLEDIGPWISMFPLDQVPDNQQGAGGVSNVRDLAIIEQLRAKAAAKYDLGRQIPVDVFVFSEGEPTRRDVTKVGGKPYRPADKPWPLTTKGEPMTFLAQYRFVESRDLTGDLPGDLLLVFVQDEQFWADPDEHAQACAFEWYPLGLDDLVEEEDLPKPQWTFHTCYGIRYRTVDYSDDRTPTLVAKCLPDKTKQQEPWQAWSLCRIDGMKIGGAPFWPYPQYVRPDVDLPGRLLCSLSCIFTNPLFPYPWMNHPEPLTNDEALDNIKKDLAIMGGFTFNISIDEEHNLHWFMQAAG